MNSNYRILLPVTNDPQLVQDKLSEVDLSKLILVNNFDNLEVEKLCLQAEDSGAEVHRYPKNLGLAASWNLGMKRMVEENCNFLIILSASAKFDKSIDYFIEGIIEYEIKNGPQSRYLASGAATLHCFAQTKRSVDIGGYFDGNFWPIYYEDTDYCRRSRLNGVEKEVRNLHLEKVVHSISFSNTMKDPRLFRLWQCNAGRIGQYYVKKWGNVQGSEVFEHPFNKPEIGVNEWTLEPFVGTWPDGVYEGNL